MELTQTRAKELEILLKENGFEDVAEEMGVSVSYAYKLIRKLNKELQSTGCITIPGRIDRKFFHEKFYSTKTIERSD